MSIEKIITRAKEKGTESDYLAWLRRWPSCLSDTYERWEDGQGYCEAAHVRMVHLGSGTGLKPEYMAIPLTHDEHRMQHEKGMSVFYPDDWYEATARTYLARWVNGVQPPEPEEHKASWRKEYIITSAGHMMALWLMLSKHFQGDGKPAVRVTIQAHKKRRSLKQNSAQWSDAVYGHQLEFYKQNPEAYMRDALAVLHLKMQAGRITKDDVHEMNKWLHNDGGSTARLTTVDFSDYHDAIRAHHAELDGVDFPEILDPNALPTQCINNF
jgi:hypothetical protein